MGFLRKIAIAIFALSFIVFCALFGSLPRLRKTPVGMINRLLWKKIPALLLAGDQLITGGRCARWLKRTGHYLMHENHPLILIMYLALVVAGQAIFVPVVYPQLSWLQTWPVPPLVLLPYWFTYRSAYSTASFITPVTLPGQLREYPYDRVLYHPGQVCYTCRQLRPARSKHCRICGHCVHKMDHHCIWVRNCLGRANYHHFLAMLLSLAAMLAYGAYLGLHILDAAIQVATDAQGGATGRWTRGLGWSAWFDRWTWALAANIRIGSVALLAAMTAPLAAGLLAYHLYLISAGMTTNESFKWEEWDEDVRDGYVFRCTAGEAAVPLPDPAQGPTAQADPSTATLLAGIPAAERNPPSSWPLPPGQRMVSRANSWTMEAELLPGTILGKEPWVPVQSIAEVVNIYDLGFWKNLKDALCLSLE